MIKKTPVQGGTLITRLSGKPGSERRDDLATDNRRHACV
jgi:hypothetical protein